MQEVVRTRRQLLAMRTMRMTMWIRMKITTMRRIMNYSGMMAMTMMMTEMRPVTTIE